MHLEKQFMKIPEFYRDLICSNKHSCWSLAEQILHNRKFKEIKLPLINGNNQLSPTQ